MSSGLDLLGAAVDVRAQGDSEAIAAASDDATRDLAALEFDVGEGPAREAYTRGETVLVPDLDAPVGNGWPGYVPAARAAGIGAVFAFPLQIGAARFGVLAGYAATPRLLDRTEQARCLAVAELAKEALLESSDATTDGEIDPALKGALNFRSEVFQAQGMVMVALGIGLVESLARLRGHAFSSGRSLTDIAVDVVERRISLTDDTL